jgi:hypothetical protein
MSQFPEVTKASREKVNFSPQKLGRSLERAGASPEIVDQIVTDIQTRLFQGISTGKIYRHAFSLLKKRSKKLASKYKLKQAIMELGPSGYPFEKYIGEIMKFQGFDVNIGSIVKGHCVDHEVDVEAWRERERFMIECKYSSNPGTKSDVKIPLYIHSRFQDVVKAWRKEYGHDLFYQGWVVNNTRFTTDAIEYAKCAGLRLIAWDYPQQGNLKERIELSGLYPITCLHSLNKADKRKLLDHMVVLCKELVEKPGIIERSGIEPSKHKKILREARELLTA